MSQVRTRIAPSPTGDPHVGTAYIALFNYCFAKSQGGQFVLRVEDTDRARSTAASERTILEALSWCGLRWDEGPDVGGPYGPYRQSERSELYAEAAQRLLACGGAFRCVCTEDELARSRRERAERGDSFLGYDGRCLEDPERARRRIEEGAEHVVRLVVPRAETLEVRDRLRGSIEFDLSEVDMQVLLKSDGMPTYHLANVVDDHEMRISHVLRGEEWISSAPKHALLYRYFGWQMPELIHLPLLRNPDKSKLSKRKNPTSILFYERMGFWPGALLNYLGTMGWSMPKRDGEEEAREKFSLAEMVASFDIDRVSLGGPIFDLAKLEHLNGRWIREEMSAGELAAWIGRWGLGAERARRIVELIQPRIVTLSDLPKWAAFFFSGPPALDAEMLTGKGLNEPGEVAELLQTLLWRFDELEAFDAASIEAAAREVAALRGLKLGQLMRPIFIAVSGQPSGVPMFEALPILGRDMARGRLRSAIEVCGGLGKKRLSKLRKAYDAARRA